MGEKPGKTSAKGNYDEDGHAVVEYFFWGKPS
jgi:hypothetical protein